MPAIASGTSGRETDVVKGRRSRLRKPGIWKAMIARKRMRTDVKVLTSRVENELQAGLIRYTLRRVGGEQYLNAQSRTSCSGRGMSGGPRLDNRGHALGSKIRHPSSTASRSFIDSCFTSDIVVPSRIATPYQPKLLGAEQPASSAILPIFPQ